MIHFFYYQKLYNLYANHNTFRRTALLVSRPPRRYTVGAFSIGVALFFEKSKLRALIWHKPDLSIIISNKVMTF